VMPAALSRVMIARKRRISFSVTPALNCILRMPCENTRKDARSIASFSASHSGVLAYPNENGPTSHTRQSGLCASAAPISSSATRIGWIASECCGPYCPLAERKCARCFQIDLSSSSVCARTSADCSASRSRVTSVRTTTASPVVRFGPVVRPDRMAARSAPKAPRMARASANRCALSCASALSTNVTTSTGISGATIASDPADLVAAMTIDSFSLRAWCTRRPLMSV